jgi:hypothetical protein
MSERLSQPSPEAPRKHAEAGPERRAALPKVEHQPSAHEKQEQIKSIRQEVGKEARGAGDMKLDHNSERSSAAHTAPVNRELKAMMRDRTLKRVQKELNAPQRTLSKVVHAKPVEIVSAAGEKTIARPFGLLGGGLFAFIGSLVTFYTAKHYGFRYNLLLFFMLFVLGYLVATLFEILVRTVQRAR